MPDERTATEIGETPFRSIFTGLIERDRMPLRILHQIAGKKLPVTVRGIRSVETVRVLMLGGHIEAIVPEAAPTLNPSSPVAIVTRITPMGQRMLLTFPKPSTSRRQAVDKPSTSRRYRVPGLQDA